MSEDEGMEWLLRATAVPASLQATVETSCESKLRTCMRSTRFQAVSKFLGV